MILKLKWARCVAKKNQIDVCPEASKYSVCDSVLSAYALKLELLI